MDYVDAEPWPLARLQDADAVARLGSVLYRLHGLTPPACAPTDGLALLRANCAVLSAHGAGDAHGMLQHGERLAARLDALPRRAPVLCHGDPDTGNLRGSAPILIDFEYAQVADPTYDLALLLAYYPVLEPRLELLLRTMGLDDELSRQRLPLQLELCRAINGAWARAQALLA
jgi:aminoglycoside phosphotransferase (APT) family kinase protein